MWLPKSIHFKIYYLFDLVKVSPLYSVAIPKRLKPILKYSSCISMPINRLFKF